MPSSNTQLEPAIGVTKSGFTVLARRLRSLSWLSFLSGIVLALGFLREIFVARQFGVGPELDVFVAVLGIYIFLGLQVGNTLEMTIISQWERIPEIDDRRKLLASVIGQLMLFLAVAISVVIAFFDDGFKLLFPSLSEAHSRTANTIMWGLAIAILFSGVSGLLRGVLNTQRIFVPGIIGGAVISLCSIISIIILSDSVGIYALVGGIIVGNAVLMVWYAVLLTKRGLLCLFRRGIKTVAVRHFWSAVFIVLIGEILFQVYGFSQRSLAARFEVGTVSAFYYASSIMLVPLTLVVMPLLTSAYPKLAATLAGDRAAGARLLMKYAALLSVFSAVAAVLLAVFAQELVNLVFVRGKFSPEAAEKTVHILTILSASLPFMALTRLVMYALYSIADYVTPVIANIVNVLVLLVAALLLVPAYSVAGLALSIVAASACASLFMIVILVWKLRNE